MIACVSLASQTCHLFAVGLDEKNEDLPMTIGNASWFLGKLTGATYYTTQGSYAKFFLKGKVQSTKMCFLTKTGVYTIDHADGTPRHYRGIIPRPEKDSTNLVINIESDGNLLSEMII